MSLPSGEITTSDFLGRLNSLPTIPSVKNTKSDDVWISGFSSTYFLTQEISVPPPETILPNSPNSEIFRRSKTSSEETFVDHARHRIFMSLTCFAMFTISEMNISRVLFVMLPETSMHMEVIN